MLKKKAGSSLDGAKFKNCRVVHHSGRPLADNLCLRSQNVQHQDCILLLPKRENPRNSSLPSYPCPNGPNKSTINRATKHLPKAPLTKPSARVPQDATDFFRDLRRILLTLIDSAYLLQSAEQLCGGRGEWNDNDETVEEMESGPEDEINAGSQGHEVSFLHIYLLTITIPIFYIAITIPIFHIAITIPIFYIAITIPIFHIAITIPIFYIVITIPIFYIAITIPIFHIAITIPIFYIVITIPIFYIAITIPIFYIVITIPIFYNYTYFLHSLD